MERQKSPWQWFLSSCRAVPGGEQWKLQCLGFWGWVWAKPETALQGSVPAGRKTNAKPSQFFLFCSSMILIREIDADSIQVVCPWLSCHVTAYSSKPVSQGMRNRWKEEESPPEVLTSSHLSLGEWSQLQTAGARKKERWWQKERLVTFLQGDSRVASLSPRLTWCGRKAWCELM